MKYIKTKYFHKWAKKNEITDYVLFESIKEFQEGLFEAHLGHKLYKKRVAAKGKGKSGSTRTILFYEKDQKIIFCFGFAKNVADNLDNDDKLLLYRLAKDFEKLNLNQMERLINTGSFIEIIMER
ncbi:MAG: type II toxin-antitoxin system RelE/ParE family toxin [Candidatus Omnitrophica bacterium]|nr:type II toxin-antitoxin system RelE/ParE family toxin [Candidatus Omnitrophota bacterium]